MERTAGRLNIPLKDGVGPDDLLLYFRLAAEGIAAEELGVPVSAEFAESFGEARKTVQHYFRRR